MSSFTTEVKKYLFTALQGIHSHLDRRDWYIAIDKYFKDKMISECAVYRFDSDGR